MKVCSKCRSEFPIEKFSPTKRNKDGSVKYRQSWCMDCRAAQNRKSLCQKEKPKPSVATDSFKECLSCKNIIPLEGFTYSKRGRFQRASYCKECFNGRYKNPEKSREYTRRYRERHNERWRASHRIHQFNRRSKIKASEDGTVTDDFLIQLLRKDLCYWCGRYVNIENRTIEHVVELSRGGPHSASNLTMACLSCNSSRKNKNGGVSV